VDWLSKLEYDAVAPLLSAGDQALVFQVKQDILLQEAGAVELLWQMPEPKKILRRQQSGGYWEFPGKNPDHRAVETFKQIRYLIEMYLMDRSIPALEAACEFLFSRQSEEGDIRGITANQMAAYYTGAILALLIKAGYAGDPRVDKGMHWLLEVRQSDGGWVEFPGMAGLKNLSVTERNLLVTDVSLETARLPAPEEPFSILATGMAIRPFCLLPGYRQRLETRRAAALLKGSFFKKNNYSTYQHPDNWVSFQFPFWWNNLAAALDSLSLCGLTDSDPDIRGALEWLVGRQRPDGLWDISYSGIHKSSANSKTAVTRNWVSLAIARILKRFSLD